MNNRAIRLLEEMKDIFGGSFGSSLRESSELLEYGKPKGKMFGGQGKGPRERMSRGGGFPADVRGQKKGKDKGKAKGKAKMDVKKLRSRGPMFSPGEPSDYSAKPGESIAADADRIFGKSNVFAKSKPGSGSRSGAEAIKAELLKSFSGGPSGKKGRSSRSAAGGGGGTKHYPFSRSSNLGPSGVKALLDPDYKPIAPVRNKQHDKTKCWQCSCGDVYQDGCDCLALKDNCDGKNSKKGETKHIYYTAFYKRSYNRGFHIAKETASRRAREMHDKHKDTPEAHAIYRQSDAMSSGGGYGRRSARRRAA